MAGEKEQRIVVGVGELTFYPEPLGQAGCSFHPVRDGRGGMLGWDAVWGTAAERDEWRMAGESFRRSVYEAERVYHAATRQGVGRYLPGALRRKERAAERFRDVMAGAEERYAPVRAEIRRRLALAKEEARREREELERRRAAEEAERKERKRVWLARLGRCHALASRAIWGWVLVGEDGTTALVHRHDVDPSKPLPPAVRRSSKPLSAYALASELEELGQGEGGVSVRWETAARERVVGECSTPGDRVRFGQWWTEVTSGRWRSPGEVPPPSPSSPGPASGRGHSGSDYGGAGGDFGGGHSGGGFSGGFGGGF
ncbi:hypothetical protein L1085_001155 [Streptomyces sp. MSC1_001]|uniref:hypothetical protein n=1 Tax=Streptomyces sp. MSC1_001 TaxID=2909263 RepID=UPI0020306A7E|nr:hypothetical protein [Streptomyces sp. MSC1_001]